jgi:DNA topoisomerase-1
MKLVIVESPTKAKTIGKYLGPDFAVTASVGHIRDLPKSNKNAIAIEEGFVPNYVIPEEKKKVVQEIRKKAGDADEVILATDPDREGEAIAWHIAESIGLGNSKSEIRNPKLRRVVFHEITKNAVEDAFKHSRDIDMDLVKAQEARRVLDRLFGYDLSGLIWTKLRYGLSAGRVQSPALRILVEREKEIRAFKPVSFWVLSALFLTKKKEIIEAECTVEPATQKEADAIVAAGSKATWHISNIEQSEAAKHPRAPFTTSTMQQAASSRFGYTPSVTMRLAQKLYEAGHITYMRTDSVNLSAEILANAKEVITKSYGSEYSNPQQYKTRSKNAQEAHEAIRPTSLAQRSAGNTAQEKKLYELIWKRTLASQMSDAKVLRTRVKISADNPASAGGASIPEFAASGVQMLFDGWTKLYGGSDEDEKTLPKVAEGDELTLKQLDHEEKQTQPPNRYSEAGLIKELEKRDIGRPSTYATIIKTLYDRGYVVKDSRSLVPTETGEVVSDFLSEHFANYISDTFTAEMEDELDEIAQGKRKYEKTLKDFYTPFKKEVASKKNVPKITNLGEAPADMKCPLCGSSMIIKLSRGGRFYSCSRFPDCHGARTIEGKVLEGPKETGEMCPKCEKGKLVEREGKYGKFVSCDRYPKCKYIKQGSPEDLANSPASTGVTCPDCKQGVIIERKGRFGFFYSCSRYPDCKFAMKAKPTGNVCPECGSLMMEGTKTIPERCSNKSCPNHNPHKLKK